MVATFVPGLAWTEMTKVDGSIRRRHPYLPWETIVRAQKDAMLLVLVGNQDMKSLFTLGSNSLLQIHGDEVVLQIAALVA